MTPADQSATLRTLCARIPVIPVLVIEDPRDATPLACALVAGRLPVLEVTLRTPAAFDAIRAITAVEGAVVGAGTVLTRDDTLRARDAGARFAVSPGLTDTLAAACAEAALPLLPGAVTASEAMRAAETGYDLLKFFPAEAAGGAAALSALAAPLPHIGFCPTGGITAANAARYLALPNVLCVGGSWLARAADLTAGDWPAIEARARIAAALREDEL